VIEGTADQARHELRKWANDEHHWGQVRNEERDMGERQRWVAIQVLQRNDRKDVFEIPEPFIAYAAANGFYIRVDDTQHRTKLIFEDDVFERLELSPEEQARREYEAVIRKDVDVSGGFASSLADHYDSVTEIADAPREALMEIAGVGETWRGRSGTDTARN